MRPVPATIHPDPIPTRTLPEAPAARANSATVGTAASSSAAAILERVPGASLPPAGSDATCASPASDDQRRCLMLHLARSDVALDHAYQTLIADGPTMTVQQLDEAVERWTEFAIGRSTYRERRRMAS